MASARNCPNQYLVQPKLSIMDRIGRLPHITEVLFWTALAVCLLFSPFLDRMGRQPLFLTVVLLDRNGLWPPFPSFYGPHWPSATPTFLRCILLHIISCCCWLLPVLYSLCLASWQNPLNNSSWHSGEPFPCSLNTDFKSLRYQSLFYNSVCKTCLL